MVLRPQAPVLVLLHGFDSSSLEYRRLLPLLGPLGLDSYAVDILGWGFGDLTVSDYSARAKVKSIREFVESKLKDREVIFVGASLGGAVALQVAHEIPSCRGLILLDAQGFTDGTGPLPPKPLLGLGVEVLKSRWLRRQANFLSYYDEETYATEDAIEIGCLHTRRAGWKEALLNFIASGGFTPTTDVARVAEKGIPTLIVWGRQDEVLPADFPSKFVEAIPSARLKYLDRCGHVPHLEQPEETASLIKAFVDEVSPDFFTAVQKLVKSGVAQKA